MHNLSHEYPNTEYETGYNNEAAYELSPEFEYEAGYSNEAAYELSPEFEYESGLTGEVQQEFAQELYEINNEYEFGSWLKRLAKKGAGMATQALGSAAGQKAIGALTGIAAKTLPGLGGKLGAAVGGAVGRKFGMGGRGAQLGASLGGQLGQRGADAVPDFVNFATDALRSISEEIAAGNASPAVVKPAIVKAAAKHYPLILKVHGTLYGNPAGGGLNNEFEWQGEVTHNEGTFSEVTEMELASELLAVQSEMELDQFLGKLFGKAVGAVSKFAKSSTGKALGGVLKGIAKKALPIAGGALGSFIPIPGVGTAIGTALGTAASNLFELELEGLSAEDREFEVARAFTRFAGNAAKRASQMRNQQPAVAAKNAVSNAARRFAPGLLSNHTQVNNYNNNYGEEGGNNGQWYRDGNRIIIEGV
jgi:uncharacterized protein (DUF697 family)